MSASLSSKAQDNSNRPARASEVVNALELTDWKPLESGIDYLSINTALGVLVKAFKIDQNEFEFLVEQQNKNEGETAASFAKRLNAKIVVNGGFFARKASGALVPVGLLRDNGKYFSKAWRNVGGYLLFKDGRGEILPTRTKIDENANEVIQSKPVIIEPNGIWALNNNLGLLKNRTIVCLKKDSSVIIVTIAGSGLSLFEAGWMMRHEKWGGWFDCDAAIALDGGGSTQLYVAGHNSLNIEGNTPVQNALIVKKRGN